MRGEQIDEITSRSRQGHRAQLVGRRKLNKTLDGTRSRPYQSKLKDKRPSLLTTTLRCVSEKTQTEDRAAKVLTCLRQFGVAVVDNLLGDAPALHIRSQCSSMALSSGLTIDPNSNAARQDRITWIHGNEPLCNGVGHLLSTLDKLITKVKQGLTEYHIEGRTMAMVACYPGNQTHYERHVDNPRGDGRVLTCVYYLNPDWNSEQDGGELRVYPAAASSGEGENKQRRRRVARVTPVLDRLVVFWSDSRTPHEVLPAYRHRYAITVWYFDKEQREEALNQLSPPLLTTTKSSPPPDRVKASDQEKTNPTTIALTKQEEDRLIDIVWNSGSESGVSFNENAAPKVDMTRVSSCTPQEEPRPSDPETALPRRQNQAVGPTGQTSI